MAEHHFDPEIYRTFFGVEREDDVQFAEDMLEALGEIDRALVPRGNTHPYMEYIQQGNDGVAPLLDFLKKPAQGTGIGDVLDALAFIFINAPASPEARKAIRGLLTDESCADLAARTLAIGRDEAFLADVMEGLTSSDPGAVAATAMLMGYGRFAPSTPLLIQLISPMRFIESRALIWAVGEIGAQDAIPVLTRCLAEGFRTVDAMIALGKIGNLATANLLIPYMVQGDTESREVALRSLSMLLAKNEDIPEAVDTLKEVFSETLRKISQEDESRTARFYALLSLGRLGEKMRQDLIRKSLDMSLRKEDMSSMQSFFTRKRNK